MSFSCVSGAPVFRGVSLNILRQCCVPVSRSSGHSYHLPAWLLLQAQHRAKIDMRPCVCCCRYGQGGSTGIQAALDSFDAASRAGAAPPPAPLHTERHAGGDGATDAHADGNTTDVDLQLLRLYAGRTAAGGEVRRVQDASFVCPLPALSQAPCQHHEATLNERQRSVTRILQVRCSTRGARMKTPQLVIKQCSP